MTKTKITWNTGSVPLSWLLVGGLWRGNLTAVINFGVIRLLGTPEPSGYQFVRPPSGALSDALAVPWPTCAFGAAPLGLAGGGVVAGIVLGIRFRHRVKAAAIPGPGFSPVHKVYAASTALAPGFKADAGETRRPRPSTATPSGGRTRARTS